MTAQRYTDAEIEALFAERVLGWKLWEPPADSESPAWQHFANGPLWMQPSGEDFAITECHPLEFVGLAMAGLEAHPEWNLFIARDPHITYWDVYIEPPGIDSASFQGGLCRAIVYACLLAVGVERERLP